MAFFKATGALDCVGHMLEAIGRLRLLLDTSSLSGMRADPDVMAAAERYVEIISEASRHVPEAWKAEQDPTIPWREIAAIGNLLRHAYDGVNPKEIWNIYANELDSLQQALERMIAAHGRATP